MSDVFLSYARSTVQFAERVTEALRALGYQVWRDDALPAHRAYGDVIEERLAAAKAVVVIWSADATRSEWVRSEANAAREAHKLVQLSIDGAKLPMPFDQIQCADLNGWTGDPRAPGWRQIIESIAELAGARSPRAAPGGVSRAPLLAVLPFDNLSNEPDLVYFSDGVSEEILQTVAQTTQLRTIGRSSSFQFRGANKAVPNVMAQLNATHVLDGSVRRSGGRVRVSVQLIDCVSQTTLWSQRIDRELTDVFVLQDEIAAAIANALNVTFAPSLHIGPIDPHAYDLFLRARARISHYLGSYDRPLLEAAVTRAPTFAKGWASLAMSCAIDALDAANEVLRPQDGSTFEVLHARALAAANTALVLDPRSDLAYVALSILEPYCGYFSQRDALLDKALAISPDDSSVLFWASRARRATGRLKEAVDFAAHAHLVDPLYAQGTRAYAVLLGQTGQARAAARIFDAARSRSPDNEHVALAALGNADVQGDWDRFAMLVHEIRNSGAYTQRLSRMIERMEAQRAWTPEDSADLLDKLRLQLATTGTISLQLGRACQEGLTDAVYDLVERASFDHLFERGGVIPRLELPTDRGMPGDFGSFWLFMLPQRPLRMDPRFVRMCARLGLCDYWQQSDCWPDCVAEVAPHYDFKEEVRRIASP